MISKCILGCFTQHYSLFIDGLDFIKDLQEIISCVASSRNNSFDGSCPTDLQFVGHIYDINVLTSFLTFNQLFDEFPKSDFLLLRVSLTGFSLLGSTQFEFIKINLNF